MEDKKLSFVGSITPFIRNIGRSPIPMKDISENGIQHTDGYELANVHVEEAEELTPEAQEEILSEEY